MESFKLGPIGQVSRRVGDIDVAVAWYRDVLELPLLYRFEDLAFFDLDGTRLFLTSADERGDARADSVIYFRVGDIHAAHSVLAARGVSFDGEPHLIYRHESGLEEWMAFFTDPDGQTLAIMGQIWNDTRQPEAIDAA